MERISHGFTREVLLCFTSLGCRVYSLYMDICHYTRSQSDTPPLQSQACVRSMVVGGGYSFSHHWPGLLTERMNRYHAAAGPFAPPALRLKQSPYLLPQFPTSGCSSMSTRWAQWQWPWPLPRQRVSSPAHQPPYLPLAGQPTDSCGGAELEARSGTEVAALFQPILTVHKVTGGDLSLSNDDLLPSVKRNFTAWDILSLWLGLVVGVPAYYLAGSLVELGMAWWQGILTVMAGNLLLLFPLILTGFAGTKYGIPFPVLCRAAFGIHGAHIPTILRGLVACGWFGIETWIGGQGIYVLLNSILNNRLANVSIQWMGTTLPEWACFFSFWILQVGIMWNGVESIRKLEKYCAPILVVLCFALLLWAYLTAGGFGAMLSATSQFGAGGAKEGQFWQVFFPALTANIGFWAPLSLNIPDITRFAKSQGDQIVGHLGLPIFMGLFTFLGLAVTSSTELIYGHIISNPIELLGQIGGVLPVLISFVGLTLATLTTNIAANVLAPANALVNLCPNVFSFRTGALVTAIVGLLFGPWQFIRSSQSYIKTWLVGYAALLGPLSSIILTDFYMLKGRKLDVDALYSKSHSGAYWYTKGFNLMAVVALVVGVLPSIPGFLYTVGLLKHTSNIFLAVYDSAWLFGFMLSGLLYWSLCMLQKFWSSWSGYPKVGEQSG